MSVVAASAIIVGTVVHFKVRVEGRREGGKEEGREDTIGHVYVLMDGYTFRFSVIANCNQTREDAKRIENEGAPSSRSRSMVVFIQ